MTAFIPETSGVLQEIPEKTLLHRSVARRASANPCGRPRDIRSTPPSTYRQRDRAMETARKSIGEHRRVALRV
jgi:hypothetical protein